MYRCILQYFDIVISKDNQNVLSCRAIFKDEDYFQISLETNLISFEVTSIQGL